MVLGEAELDDVRVVAVDSRSERRHVRLLEHCFEPAEIAEADSRETAIEVVGRCDRAPNERPVSPLPPRDRAQAPPAEMGAVQTPGRHPILG